MKNLIKIIISITFLLAACTHMDRSINDNITAPVLKKEPKLIYPFSAQQQNQRGTSTILFTINDNGEVDETRIHKSSGHLELDEAAEKYCKGLLFVPAHQNGEAIPSSMKWEIKFDLKDFGMEIEYRIEAVNDLYSEIPSLVGSKKLSAQNDILKMHNEIVAKTKDGLKFNEYMYGVLAKSLVSEWQPIGKSFPLTFLLYHDFLTRFKDFDSINVVKSRLEHALKKDLEYLNEAENISKVYKINKIELVSRIKQLVEKYYPEISLNSLNLEIKQINNIS